MWRNPIKYLKDDTVSHPPPHSSSFPLTISLNYTHNSAHVHILHESRLYNSISAKIHSCKRDVEKLHNISFLFEGPTHFLSPAHTSYFRIFSNKQRRDSTAIRVVFPISNPVPLPSLSPMANQPKSSLITTDSSWSKSLTINRPVGAAYQRKRSSDYFHFSLLPSFVRLSNNFHTSFPCSSIDLR